MSSYLLFYHLHNILSEICTYCRYTLVVCMPVIFLQLFWVDNVFFFLSPTVLCKNFAYCNYTRFYTIIQWCWTFSESQTLQVQKSLWEVVPDDNYRQANVNINRETVFVYGTPIELWKVLKSDVTDENDSICMNSGVKKNWSNTYAGNRTENVTGAPDA